MASEGLLRAATYSSEIDTTPSRSREDQATDSVMGSVIDRQGTNYSSPNKIMKGGEEWNLESELLA